MEIVQIPALADNYVYLLHEPASGTTAAVDPPEAEGVLRALAGLKPETLAVMHGSSYRGQGDQQLTLLAEVIRRNFDQA